MRKRYWAYLLMLLLLLVTSVYANRERSHRRELVSLAPPGNLYGAGKPALPVSSTSIELPDPQRGKPLPVRVTWPDAPGPFPVIVFSHGAWGSKDGYQPLIRPWVEHGYVVLQPTHPDSTREGTRLLDRRAFLHWKDRPEQIKIVLDALPTLDRLIPALKGKMDLSRIGMAGHSFGADTTQLVAGDAPTLFGKQVNLSDPRPKAFIALSPPGEGGNARRKDDWKDCSRPMLVMSGSKDGPTQAGLPAEARKITFTDSPPGDKYLAWVEGLDHGYGGISGTHLWPKNPDHLAWTLALTTAFWDCYLKQDATAKAYLASDDLPKASGGMVALSRK